MVGLLALKVRNLAACHRFRCFLFQLIQQLIAEIKSQVADVDVQDFFGRYHDHIAGQVDLFSRLIGKIACFAPTSRLLTVCFAAQVSAGYLGEYSIIQFSSPGLQILVLQVVSINKCRFFGGRHHVQQDHVKAYRGIFPVKEFVPFISCSQQINDLFAHPADVDNT